jgi:hypothetical protein
MEMLVAMEKLVDGARAPIVKDTAGDAINLLKILGVCTFVFETFLKLIYHLAARQMWRGSPQGTPRAGARDHGTDGPLIRRHERRYARRTCGGTFREAWQVSFVSLQLSDALLTKIIWFTQSI